MSISIDLLSNPSAPLCYALPNSSYQITKIAYSSFPSSAIHYSTETIARQHVFARIQPHHVINTLCILILIGFLSWSLDSQHGDTLKYIEPAPVVVESISSIDPKADRRKSILQKNRRERRKTIENIAHMLEIEDQKRQEIFGPGPSPLDTSAAARAVGIGGGDVGLRVWSLNQEMHLLREIDLQLEKVGLGAFANPIDQKPINKPISPPTEENKKKEEDQCHFEINIKKPPTSSKKLTWTTFFMLRLRVPLKWVM